MSDRSATAPGSVLTRQVERLAADLRALVEPVARQVRAALDSPEWTVVEEVHLTGAGDSHHAARAAVLAFESIARVACRPSSAHELAEYGAPALRLRSGQPLVVAASVSGRTPRVVTAIERARANGALTLAVTGTSDSPAANAAHRNVVLELADLERSPGIRTYQATLLALLLTAIELGRARGACSDPEAETRRGELVALADDVAHTAGGIKACCREVADTITGAPAVVVAGSGPSFGTALFAAAKIVEASGVVAVPQDLEEWWHVERHAAPADIPTFVVAPPDRSHPRAAAVAAAAESLGRTVIAVVREGDQDVARHASAVVLVHGDVREELSPLLYHLFAGYVAEFLAERLGRPAVRERRGPATLDAFLPGVPPGTDEVAAQVVEVLRRHAASDTAAVLDAPDADLALLGLDSLELTELIVDLETSLAFEFPADLLDPATFRTVGSIASAVEASRG